MPAEVRCEVFGEIWFEIGNLWCEISGEIWGWDFATCQESTKHFGANFGKVFGGNFVSNFASFFGNFVQQKGGVSLKKNSRDWTIWRIPFVPKGLSSPCPSLWGLQILPESGWEAARAGWGIGQGLCPSSNLAWGWFWPAPQWLAHRDWLRNMLARNPLNHKGSEQKTHNTQTLTTHTPLIQGVEAIGAERLSAWMILLISPGGPGGGQNFEECLAAKTDAKIGIPRNSMFQIVAFLNANATHTHTHTPGMAEKRAQAFLARSFQHPQQVWDCGTSWQKPWDFPKLSFAFLGFRGRERIGNDKFFRPEFFAWTSAWDAHANLVAFQTQTQNRKFPNRNPASGGSSKSQF